MSDQTNDCPRTECGSPLDEGVCHACGYGSKLSDVPDYEAGKLWDEWFYSFTREEMKTMFKNDSVHENFNMWLSARSQKH